MIQSAALEPGEKDDREAIEATSAAQADDQAAAFTQPEAVERRVWRNIFVVIALGLIAASSFAQWNFALGLAIGGALALLNFKWLHSSVKDILSAGASTAPPGTTMMFAARWLVVAIVIYGATLTGLVKPLAMLTGLFAPAIAVVIEAVYVTVKTLIHSGEDKK
ncbi:MAG: ATP synthase subunit I [Acidobacteria bacterium]|nr:ATP synthase subunit I [Acidobacteriota bacterium]